MYLELTTLPQAVGGPIAFAHVPWQMPVNSEGDLRINVLTLVDAFTNQR